MELTNKYKRPATFTSLRTQVKESLLGFINQHSDVLEALSRPGAPFGGNWLRGSYAPAAPVPSQSTHELMACIQQQLSALTGQVAQLSTRIDSAQAASGTDTVDQNRMPAVSPATQIGIYRFRALRTKARESA